MKKLPTVDIKGKEYTLVKDRVLYFNEAYKNGSIVTEKSQDGDRVEFKATVTPDVDRPTRIFTGHSQSVWGDGYINKTSALENAETSAVGRALALMGIGVIESIASADEINKAKNTEHFSPKKWNEKPVEENPTVEVLPESAFEAAKKAIGDADTAKKLDNVEARINKSTNLSTEEKDALYSIADSKRQQFA